MRSGRVAFCVTPGVSGVMASTMLLAFGWLLENGVVCLASVPGVSAVARTRHAEQAPTPHRRRDAFLTPRPTLSQFAGTTTRTRGLCCAFTMLHGTSFCASSADAIGKERSSSDFGMGRWPVANCANGGQMRVTRRASVASRSIVGPSRPRSGWPRGLSLVPRHAGTRARGSGSNLVRLQVTACSDEPCPPPSSKPETQAESFKPRPRRSCVLNPIPSSRGF